MINIFWVVLNVGLASDVFSHRGLAGVGEQILHVLLSAKREIIFFSLKLSNNMSSTEQPLYTSASIILNSVKTEIPAINQSNCQVPDAPGQSLSCPHDSNNYGFHLRVAREGEEIMMVNQDVFICCGSNLDSRKANKQGYYIDPPASDDQKPVADLTFHTAAKPDFNQTTIQMIDPTMNNQCEILEDAAKCDRPVQMNLDLTTCDPNEWPCKPDSSKTLTICCQKPCTTKGDCDASEYCHQKGPNIPGFCHP